MRRDEQTASVEALADELADRVRDAILARTGLKASELQCPREKSDMTPCIARDGRLARAYAFFYGDMCAGCEFSLQRMREQEGISK